MSASRGAYGATMAEAVPIGGFVIGQSAIGAPNTSGTFNYNPTLGEVVLNAYSRLKIRGPMITAEHMSQATAEANLMQEEWNNRGPNLWTVDLQTFLTVPGFATYAVPPETVMILDTYMTQFAQTAGFQGSIAGTTLTVTSFVAGEGNLVVGMALSDLLGQVLPGTTITALGSGTGGAGTYTISQSLTVGAELMFGVLLPARQQPQQPLSDPDLAHRVRLLSEPESGISADDLLVRSHHRADDHVLPDARQRLSRQLLSLPQHPGRACPGRRWARDTRAMAGRSGGVPLAPACAALCNAATGTHAGAGCTEGV